MSQMFKIFIGNVSFKTTEDHLRPFFERHLTIDDLVIARDAEGKHQGYGFVMTKDADAGRRAMYRIGKFELDGRRIYLKEAHGKKLGHKPGKRPGGGGGGRGGQRPMRGPSNGGGGGGFRRSNSPQRPQNAGGYERPQRPSQPATGGYVRANVADPTISAPTPKPLEQS